MIVLVKGTYNIAKHLQLKIQKFLGVNVVNRLVVYGDFGIDDFM